MAEINEQIESLEKRLENLVKTQIGFQQEITQIRNELKNLSNTANVPPVYKPTATQTEIPKYESPPPPKVEDTNPKPQQNRQSSQSDYVPAFGYAKKTESQSKYESTPIQPEIKSNVEKFIGQNLLSLIGVLILILGVAIGAKYAIDNNLISPLMRIVFGYVFGFGLLGFALKLKEKYLNFSAVLLSGAMAIMYFITFFAYNLYELFSQSTAFVLMLIFTVFTVAAAINYSRQVIAHIGLVGAYAIPFLLSNDSGNYAFLFTYIAIINAGILAISVVKYWKSLHFSSFIMTWLIFSGWFFTKYRADENFNLAFIFLIVNFLTFYITFIVYKVINLRHIAIENLSLIFANSFIFFALGYTALESRIGFEQYQGLFAVANAALHLAFAFAVSRLKTVSQDLVYLLSALVITSATIAVPIQLQGSFVTLIWTVEAAILFWIGRTKGIRLFEIYSFPLMLLASLNLLQDWGDVAGWRNLETVSAAHFPFYNGNFFTSLFFAAAFLFIYLTNRARDYKSVLDENLRRLLGILTITVFTIVFYNAFRTEIGNYFHFLIVKTGVISDEDIYRRTDTSLSFFNIVWQINYTMLFLSLLSFINIKKVKSFSFALGNLILNSLILFIFITVGLFCLSELRENYLLQTDAELFTRGIFHIWIRYVSYIFAAGLILSSYLYLKQPFVKESFGEKISVLAFDFVLYVSLLVIVSSELLNWMNIFGYNDSYKLGLSILWGVYALSLIVIGIYQHKKHLRIGAIALFGITLAKLFIYDIANLDTISKTIVFVSLGILLLIVSFLYNKYKSLIFD